MPVDQPQCKTCYKLLPWSMQGFDICPMCLMKQRAKQAAAPKAKRPSYESPLAVLERELYGRE